MGPETIHQESTATRGRTATRGQRPADAHQTATRRSRTRDRHRGRVGRSTTWVRTQRRRGPPQLERHRPQGVLRRPDGLWTGAPRRWGANHSRHPMRRTRSSRDRPPTGCGERWARGVGQLDGAESGDRGCASTSSLGDAAGWDVTGAEHPLVSATTALGAWAPPGRDGGTVGAAWVGLSQGEGPRPRRRAAAREPAWRAVAPRCEEVTDRRPGTPTPRVQAVRWWRRTTPTPSHRSKPWSH